MYNYQHFTANGVAFPKRIGSCPRYYKKKFCQILLGLIVFRKAHNNINIKVYIKNKNNNYCLFIFNINFI